jgi:hypothetical protein
MSRRVENSLATSESSRAGPGPTDYMSASKQASPVTSCVAKSEIAPALIPKRESEPVEANTGGTRSPWPGCTDRRAYRPMRSMRRSVTLCQREAAVNDLRRKLQRQLSFLLCRGRIYGGGGHWALAHRRWLAGQAFEHSSQQTVFQEASTRRECNGATVPLGTASSHRVRAGPGRRWLRHFKQCVVPRSWLS